MKYRQEKIQMLEKHVRDVHMNKNCYVHIPIEYINNWLYIETLPKSHRIGRKGDITKYGSIVSNPYPLIDGNAKYGYPGDKYSRPISSVHFKIIKLVHRVVLKY